MLIQHGRHIPQQQRSSSVLALEVFLVVVCVMVSGCSTVLSHRSSNASAPVYREISQTWSPCWVPNSGKSVCGGLVSVSGRMPDAGAVDFPDRFSVTPSGPLSYGRLLLVVTPAADDVCSVFSVPVRIVGEIWYPTGDIGGPACGHIAAVDLGYEPLQIMRFFSESFRSEVVDDETVRLYNASSWIVLRWM